ncbi:MAG: acireductone synthase [Candidatus Obscuribacterales bacterium]|nr:acireductone synthase [Candidatus Obscuribacterales bacterium]
MNIRGVLLDIEGTVSPVSFVYDVLFPFARNNAESFLGRTAETVETKHALQLMAKDAGFSTLEEWSAAAPEKSQLEVALEEVNRLMDNDIKATGLKELQGLIWAEGYASGVLNSVVFDDVPVALSDWKKEGCSIRIYSSGSATAQKVFFENTIFGNLCCFLSGYYDTTLGAKREATSYERIADAFGLPAREIVFLSDVPAELDAAKAAGMQTRLVVRKGNASAGEHQHAILHSFLDFEISNRVECG